MRIGMRDEDWDGDWGLGVGDWGFGVVVLGINRLTEKVRIYNICK